MLDYTYSENYVKLVIGYCSWDDVSLRFVSAFLKLVASEVLIFILCSWTEMYNSKKTIITIQQMGLAVRLVSG